MCTMQAANANDYKPMHTNGKVIYNNSIGTSFHCTLVCIYTYMAQWANKYIPCMHELKTPQSSPMVSTF